MTDPLEKARRGLTLTTIARILILFGVVQVIVGIFQYVQFERLSNVSEQTNDLARQTQSLSESNARQTRCQALYNESFATAYRPRADGTAEVIRDLFRFLRTAGPVIKGSSTPDERIRFTTTYDQAVRTYNQYTIERRRNPLPPIPSEYCGVPPK